MDKNALVEIFEEMATMLELRGENPFKSRAYRNGARALQSVEQSLDELISSGGIDKVKGLGKALKEKAAEALETGEVAAHRELRASTPEGLFDMLDTPGLGAKKVQAIYQQLGIETLDALETACHDGRIEKLSGFGKKTAEKILQGIEFRRANASRFRLDVATSLAEEILSALRTHPDTLRCAIAGSLRRSKETVGDLDFIVSSREPDAIMDGFASLDRVRSVELRGPTKMSVILEGGLQADLRVVDDAAFPFAWHYFTGSKEHNIVMRQRALERGLRLSEYGLFPKDQESDDRTHGLVCRDERELFEALDLDFIPPELREDEEEFSAAEERRLPRLIEWTQLKGSLHNHSNWSDGAESLEEIARYMIDLGLEYWAITDHSKSSFQANGLDESRLERQLESIGEWNQRLEDEGESFRFLSGIEVDILSNGGLDFSDELLSRLDIVVASVHSGFTQSEKEMTRRIVRAIERKPVRILGHPTGRLLLERDPYAVDMRAVIDACAGASVWIELNASPYRMDMDWRLWRYAKSKGVRCAINVDAHRNAHAGHLKLGAGLARKGWLTRDDVVNCEPLESLMRMLDSEA